jgi:hypothetical protein
MTRWIMLLVAAAALALAAGCSTNVERADSGTAATAVPTQPPADPAAAAPTPPEGSATPAAAPGYEATLKEIEQLEAAYRQNPNDAQAKAKLVSAKYEYGAKLMMDDNVPPRQKYRPALLAFNEVLELDPNHKEAKTNKTMIEDIYRSMGMPIPK